MDKELRILILEDVPTDAELMKHELKKGGILFTSRLVETKEGFLGELKEFTPEIILSDFKMPQFDGMAALSLTKEFAPNIPFIIVTGSMNEETAVECMKAGAADYVIKDHLSRISLAVKGALGNKQVKEEKERLQEALWTSAREWRTTFDALNYPVALMNLDRNIRRCNKAMANLLGKPFNEIIGRNCCELMHSKSGPIEGCPVERMRETRERETLLLTLKDRWFNIVVDPVFDENKNFVGAVHIMSDITENKRAEEALKESEKRYRQVVENATEIIYSLDTKGNFTYGNPAGLKATGFSLEELRQYNYQDLIVPEHRERLTSIYIKQFLERQATTYVEFPFFNRSGEIIWFGQNAFLVIEDGKVLGFHMIARDITERKKAEQALSESEQRYRNLVENAPDVIFTLGPNGTITTLNPAFERITGWSRSEWLHKQFASILHPDDLSRGLEFFQRIMKGEKIAPFELRVLRKSGDYLVAEFVVTPQTQNGSVIGILGIARDITERKRAEEMLGASEERYRTLFEGAAEGILVADIESKQFKYVNPATCRMLGYTAEELTRLSLADIHPKEALDYVVAEFEAQARGEKALSPEIPCLRKDGSVIYTSIATAPVVIGGRKCNVGFFMDITERKKAEEALRESEEKYRLLVENANEAIFVIQDGMLRFFNIKNIELIGYSKEELTSTPFINFVHPDDREVTLGRYLKRIRGEELPGVNVFRIIDKAGNIKWAEVNSVLISWEGRPATLNFLNDITERKRAEEALRSSEEKYRTILETIQEGYYEVDMTGNFTLFNDSLCRMLGYTKDELMGMNNRQYMDKETAKKVYQVFNQLYTTGEPYKTFDWEIIRKDGTKRFHDSSVSLIRNEKGEGIGFRGIARDITERKKTEEALRESEERFRELYDNAPVGYFEYDTQGRITNVNRTELEILGYTFEEMIGQPVWKFIVEEEIARQQILAKLAGTIPPVRGLERNYKKKDGTVLPVSIEDRILRDPQGKITGIRCTIQDITERKRAEETLQLTQFSVEHAPESVLWINPKGQLDYANEAAYRALGYSREELVSMSLWDIDPDFPQESWSTHWQNLPKRGPLTRESHHRTKDGKIFPIEITGDYLKYGDMEYNVAFIRDITERKKAEDKMTALQDQLRQSQKMEAIGRLAGGIAHDFNNILTVIKGYSQLSLTEMKEGDPLKENIKEIKKSADRAADLTRQLLAFSRRQVMEMKVLDLNDLLRNLDKMLHRVIGEDIELATILEENLGRVKTDPGQVEQVIMNLAVNARDAMSKGGKLTIETANVDLDQAYARAHVAVKPGPYVMISVSDTGVGMPPEIRDRIFEPFFTTKEKGKGTGLGLSTVYGIVKQSGGNIWVYSEPEKGTTFKIYLPRVDEPFEELKEKLLKEELPRGNETILIVEDEEDVLKLAGRILSRQGYHVLEASSGEEALRICKKKKEPFHLLLTDVVMPQMSGRQLEQQLSRVCQDFKVLYMSGYTDNAITHHGVLEKGLNYIQKPFTVDSLIRKVREVLDK